MQVPTDGWVALPFEQWAGTKRTVHRYTQMLGKLRLALVPPQPQWLGSALDVQARGLTTGPMPWETALVEVSLDFFDHVMRVATSNGQAREIDLAGAESVAAVWEQLLSAVAELGIEADLWDKPQEVADVTPFAEDTGVAEYDVDAVRRWWKVIAAVRGVFEQWRSPFFGRSHVVFWWGAFDLAVLRFTGNKAVAPKDRGYIMLYDLDAEFMNAGFWPGDETAPNPVFYAYLYPKPEGCELAPIDPAGAAWIEQMGEWVLPYDDALATGEPARAVLGFLERVYEIAGEYGGWDLPAFTYTPPAPSARQ